MRGRRPVPTPLKRIRGNPGRRPLPEAEPQPRAITPECPPHLDDEAKAEWDKIVPELAMMGVLTIVDRAALAAYCVNWSRWVRAEDWLEKQGEVLRGMKGNYQNPYLAIANRAQKEMRAFATEFGMTPASRTRVKAGPPKSVDAFEDFLSASHG